MFCNVKELVNFSSRLSKILTTRLTLLSLLYALKLSKMLGGELTSHLIGFHQRYISLSTTHQGTTIALLIVTVTLLDPMAEVWPILQ